jgi:hypothetical protein
MTIGVRCGSCDRELLLVQLLHPSDGFRCLFCGFAFAPGYATVAPGVAARVMAAHATLVTALTELQSMTGDRLRLDRATVIGPVAESDQVVRLVKAGGSAAAFDEQQGDVVVELSGDMAL